MAPWSVCIRPTHGQSHEMALLPLFLPCRHRAVNCSSSPPEFILGLRQGLWDQFCVIIQAVWCGCLMLRKLRKQNLLVMVFFRVCQTWGKFLKPRYKAVTRFFQRNWLSKSNTSIQQTIPIDSAIIHPCLLSTKRCIRSISFSPPNKLKSRCKFLFHCRCKNWGLGRRNNLLTAAEIAWEVRINSEVWLTP